MMHREGDFIPQAESAEETKYFPARTGRESLRAPLSGPRRHMRDFLIRQFKHVNSEDDTVVLERIARGELTEESIKTFLQNPPLPQDKLPVFFDADKFKDGVVGVFIKRLIPDIPFSDHQWLEKFYEKFPEPATFEERIVGFLAYENQEADINHAEDLFRAVQFMRLVYGERYEYWDQLKRLQREAMEQYPAYIQGDEDAQVVHEMNALVLRRWLKSRLTKQLHTKSSEMGGKSPSSLTQRFRLFDEDELNQKIAGRISELGGGLPSIMPILEAEAFREFSGLIQAPEYEKPPLVPLHETLKQRILHTAEVHGDVFEERSLTQEVLEREGVVPYFKIPLDGGATCYVSLPYEFHNRRIVTAYLQENGHTVARTYYLSGSQALWRYLPRYMYYEGDADDEGRITWFDKGFSEYSITLPSALQRGLAGLPAKEGLLSPQDPGLLFAGTARRLEFPGERDLSATYQVEVREQGLPLNGNFYDESIPPEKIIFNDPDEAPDFSEPLTSWRQDSKIYGEIHVELYMSRNGKYRYMMCTDGLGRSWVGGIECPGAVHSTGLYSVWVNPGVLATPAFEYWEQAGDRGNAQITGGTRSEYVDVFTNYLSRIPIIKEYVEVIKRRGLSKKK